MIGKTISHYKILSKLGEGGMGVVYKAEDTELKREVAIKFLPPHITKHGEERKRFRVEAQAAAGLNHNNIATIFSIEETDDEMFIVMEYIKGQELKDKIEAGPLSIENTLNLSTQIAQGLQVAHEKGVVHRDIKSANIMLTDRGDVKIMDFGLAKLAGRTMLTKEGTTLGTTAYMSPEQGRGETVDHRTDIWSVGIILYEMLTGQLPFKGDYEQSIMYSIMNEGPEPITGLRTGVSMELERIVNKALKKKPAERYQSLGEMLVDLNSVSEEAATGKGRALPKQTRKAPLTAGLFFLVALVVGSGFFYWWQTSSDNPGLNSNEKSIAVMPFTDMSPEKDQAYFADGMAEEIINALTQIPGLKVSARTSAFQFREQENDIQTIGAKLGVTTILKGSVRKSGNTLRITAQLVNVADGFHLWSETYDRQLTDVFAIQDDLSSSIVTALQIKLSVNEAKTLDKRTPANVEAYNYYLKGRYFWNRRSEEALLESIDYFNQAIELDPTYALAYTGLADSYNMLGIWQLLDPNVTFSKAKAAALRALELDNTISEAHVALAFVKTYYDWDWFGAEEEFKLGIELNPSYASAHHWYAQILAFQGRHDEARVEINKALELEPLSLIINGVSGWLYQWAGQYNEALEKGLKTLAMDPNFVPTHYYLFVLYLETKMYDKAFTHFIEHFSSHYNLINTEVETLKKLYKDSGWQGVGGFMVDKLEAMSNEKYISHLEFSVYYIMVKNYSRALDYLEEAYQMRSPQMLHIGAEAKFIDLRGEPRFQALLKKMGLPQ